MAFRQCGSRAEGSLRPHLRTLRILLVALSSLAVVAVTLVVPPLSPAQAFKPTTHMTASQRALDSIVQRDSRYYVVILGREIPIDPEIGQALTRYPDVFLAGSTGPDAFPDPLFGQSVIHPSGSNHWARKVMREARRHGAPGTPARLKAVAFAQGFLSHGAADYWGHAFVNHHAGGVFPELTDVGRIDIAVKHVILETYIDLFRPNLSGVQGAIERGLDLDPAATLTGDNDPSQTAPPYGFISDVFMESPEARAYLPTTPIYRMLKLWECGQKSCSEYFPNQDNLAWYNAKKVALPSPEQQREARAKLLARYTQNFGAQFINKFVYAKAAPDSEIARRANRQWNEFLLGGFCKVALRPELCDGIASLKDLAEKLSDALGKTFTWAKKAMQYFETQLARMMESSIDHVLGELQAMLDRSDVPREKREWVMRVLDVDKNGAIEFKDFNSLDFAQMVKLTINGEIPCPSGRSCFDGDAVNRALGIDNPLRSQTTQTWDPQRFAAINNAVSLTKLNMLDSAGRRALVAAFAPGERPTFEPSWEWITTFDGHGHGLNREEFDRSNIMAATQWDMFRNPVLRTGLFNRLFVEPIPGFFRNADEEFTGEGVVPRKTMGVFVNGLGPNLCLDANGASRDNGTKIQLWGCNTSAAQQAQLVNGQLRLNGKCVDAPSGNSAAGTKVQLWDCHGGDNQQVSYRDGQLRLMGKCLDVEGTSTTFGTAVHLWECHNGQSQRWSWRADPVQEGYLQNYGAQYECLHDRPGPNPELMYLKMANCRAKLANNELRTFRVQGERLLAGRPASVIRKDSRLFRYGKDRGKCLDVVGGDFTSGTPLGIWDCNGTAAQEFEPQWQSLRPTADPNKCLDVDGGAQTGRRLHLSNCDKNTPSQVIEIHGNRLKVDGRCLAVKDQSTTNGAAIELRECTGGSDQEWVSEPTTTDPGMCAIADGGYAAFAPCNRYTDRQVKVSISYPRASGGFQLRTSGGDSLCLTDEGEYVRWSRDCSGDSARSQWQWWHGDGQVFDPEAECDMAKGQSLQAAGLAGTATVVRTARGDRCLPRMDVSLRGRQAHIEWRKWKGWTYRSAWSGPGLDKFGKWRKHPRAAIVRDITPGSSYRVKVQAIRAAKDGKGIRRSEVTRISFDVD